MKCKTFFSISGTFISIIMFLFFVRLYRNLLSRDIGLLCDFVCLASCLEYFLLCNTEIRKDTLNYFQITPAEWLLPFGTKKQLDIWESIWYSQGLSRQIKIKKKCWYTKAGSFTHFYVVTCLETEKLVNFLRNNFQMQEISVMKRKWIAIVFKDVSSFSSSPLTACGLGLTSEA